MFRDPIIHQIASNLLDAEIIERREWITALIRLGNDTDDELLAELLASRQLQEQALESRMILRRN